MADKQLEVGDKIVETHGSKYFLYEVVEVTPTIAKAKRYGSNSEAAKLRFRRQVRPSGIDVVGERDIWSHYSFVTDELLLKCEMQRKLRLFKRVSAGLESMTEQRVQKGSATQDDLTRIEDIISDINLWWQEAKQPNAPGD